MLRKTNRSVYMRTYIMLKYNKFDYRLGTEADIYYEVIYFANYAVLINSSRYYLHDYTVQTRYI